MSSDLRVLIDSLNSSESNCNYSTCYEDLPKELNCKVCNRSVEERVKMIGECSSSACPYLMYKLKTSK